MVVVKRVGSDKKRKSCLCGYFVPACIASDRPAYVASLLFFRKRW